MNAWKASRRRRNLDTGLEVRESVYFSPPSITSWNKLTADPAFANMENHVFELVKTGGLDRRGQSRAGSVSQAN